MHLSPRDVLNASCVSRAWRTLALDKYIWRTLYERQSTWGIRPSREPPADEPWLSVNDPVMWRSATRKLNTPSSASAFFGAESSRRQHGALIQTPVPPALSSTRPSAARLAAPSQQVVPELDRLAISPLRDHPDRASASTLSTPLVRQLDNRHFYGCSDERNLAPLAHGSNVDDAATEAGSSSREVLYGAPPLTPSKPGRPPAIDDDDDALEWYRLYRDRHILETRWDKGDGQMLALCGHQDAIYCVQFDTYKVVSGSRDCTIKIWDITTGECLRTLKGHDRSVLCLQYDDRIIVSGSSDTRVMVWDIRGDECGRGAFRVLHTLVGHTGGVLDVNFDDDYIVSCSKDATIRVYDRDTAKLRRCLRGHLGAVNAVKLVAGGGKVISAAGDQKVRIWDIKTGAVLREFLGHEGGLACLEFSPTGSSFITGSSDRTIKLWDAERAECVRTFKGHTDIVRTLAFDEKRRRIVSGSYDHTIRVWDMDTGKELVQYTHAHSSMVFGVKMSVSRIVSSSHDKNLVVLDFGYALDVARFT